MVFLFCAMSVHSLCFNSPIYSDALSNELMNYLSAATMEHRCGSHTSRTPNSTQLFSECSCEVPALIIKRQIHLFSLSKSTFRYKIPIKYISTGYQLIYFAFSLISKQLCWFVSLTVMKATRSEWRFPLLSIIECPDSSREECIIHHKICCTLTRLPSTY